jgi:RHS repeat-associated protein
MEVYFYLPDGRLVATYERIWRWAPDFPNEWCLKRVGERVWFAGTLLTVDGERVYTDRLGSVVRRGTQVYRYYPHGEPFGTNPVTTGPHFATYERDQVAGLDQAWNRGYLPTYGRFAQGDPYQASGGAGDPGSWNRYGYVGGDPVNFYDPPGLFMAVPQPNGHSLSHGIPNAGGFPLGGGGAPEIEVRETEEASGGGTFLEPPIPPECDETDPVNARVLGFIRRNQDSASTLAQETGLSAGFILAWAAMESGWGFGGAATRNNNFFGLTTNNWPNAIGCPEGAFAGFACFAVPEGGGATLLPSGRSALSSANQRYLRPALEAQAAGGGPAAIAAAIANAGFNSEHDDHGVTYGNSVQGTFNSIQRRRHCLDP